MIAVAAITALAGCATQPDKLAAQSVSPLLFQGYACDQVVLEMDRVGTKVGQLYHDLRKAANNDTAQMAIGVLLFWPTLFLLEGGDGPEAAEYARLKGEYEALQTVAVQKRCDTRLVKTLDEYIPEDAGTERLEVNDTDPTGHPVTDTSASTAQVDTLPATGEPASAAQRLAHLQRLYESNLLSAAEYSRKKRQIIDEL